MRRARVAQPIDEPRGIGVDGGHRRVMRVEQAQDVPLEAVPLQRRQLRGPGLVVGGQLLDVCRPAGAVADRIEQHLHARHPRVGVEAQTELDDLRVDSRAGVADRLDIELPELPVAPRLRAVVAEHRPDLVDLDRLRPGLHPVLHVRPDDAGGRFGSEGPGLGFLAARDDPEELLLDDVGDLADAALEERDLLEQSASRCACSRSGTQGRRPGARSASTSGSRRAGGRACRVQRGRWASGEV